MTGVTKVAPLVLPLVALALVLPPVAADAALLLLLLLLLRLLGRGLR